MTKKAQRRKCRCAFFRGYKRNSRLFLRGLVKPHVHGDEPQRDCQKPETCNCQIVKCAVTEEQRHQQCGTQRKENRLHEALHGSGQTSGLRQEVHGNQGHAWTNDTDADGVDHQGQNSPDDAFGQQARHGAQGKDASGKHHAKAHSDCSLCAQTAGNASRNPAADDGAGDHRQKEFPKFIRRQMHDFHAPVRRSGNENALSQKGYGKRSVCCHKGAMSRRRGVVGK